MNFIKEKIKNLSNKEFNINKSLIILALLALFSVIFQIIVQNYTSDYWLENYFGFLKSPLLILFNFLPFFLLTLLFYFLLNSISKSFIIVNMVSTLLLIINHYKIFFRDTPLKLNDFFIGREALNIVQNYKLEFDFPLFISVFFMLFLFVFLIKFLHNKKNNTKVRILGAIISTSLIVISYFFIYQNTSLYENILKPANEFYDVDVVNSKGLIYSLLSQKTMKKTYQKPENYSEESVKNLIAEYNTNTSNDKKYPNIIAIMSEAFFDPQTAKNLGFYKNKNPLTNFNKLKKDAYYGNIIVPGFAGATASTEFEFLTGMNISNIDSTMPDIYKTHVNSKLYSLIDIFKNLNYKTLAIHPGFSWFYNRNMVYKYMGFDNMIFKSDLPSNSPQVNYYISDEVTADLIIDNYSKHLNENSDKGYFNFTVTIQNHGPYSTTQSDNKFIVKPDNMDDELYNVLNNYISGLNDADKLLGKVTDFVSDLDEPTVIVFFGDHLPYLDSDLKAYEDIGYPIYENNIESVKLKYSTPYIIWGNKAAKNLISSQGGKVLKGKNEDISSNYLGLKLLEYINMDLPPFFNFLKDIENKIPIISKDYYYINNKFEFTLPGELNSYINNYKIWSYYNLMQQK